MRGARAVPLRGTAMQGGRVHVPEGATGRARTVPLRGTTMKGGVRLMCHRALQDVRALCP